jgi:hypothetical protein
VRTCIANAALLASIAVLTLVAWTVPALAAEPTTSVRVAKYAADGTTVVAEESVDYQWMEANLPVQGDGVTHYFHQGPVFEGDKWDPDETANLKDKGAVMGTDIKDLCDLVGGMADDDTVVICAADGYCVDFGYSTVYEPPERQGPIVLCWYNGEGAGGAEAQGEGYPPSYYNAMQLLFMAETTNEDGKYVFGNCDMHECLPEEAQHFYGELYPSTNGLSVKWISEILVHSSETAVASLTDPAGSGSGGQSTNRSSQTWWIVAAAALGVAALFLLGVVIGKLVRR